MILKGLIGFADISIAITMSKT